MSFAVPLKYENVGNELRCCYRKRFAPHHLPYAVPLKYENVENELGCCYRKRFAPQHLQYAVPFFVFYVFAVFQHLFIF